MSVTDSLCLSQTVCIYHRLSLTVTDSLCMSQTVYVCHRQILSVIDSLCLSQTVFVYHIESVSVTDTLLIHSWPDFILFFTWFSSWFEHETLICPGCKSHQDKLGGPLHETRNMWHVTRGTWLVVNTLSECQLPNSNGLGFMMSGRFGRQRLNPWINQRVKKVFVEQPRLQRVR